MTYEHSYETLRQQIAAISLQTAVLLDELLELYGVELAYYGAYMIACLEVRRLSAAMPEATKRTLVEMRGWDFFEVSGDRCAARILFKQALSVYFTDSHNLLPQP